MKPYFKVLYNEIRFWWLKLVHCGYMTKNGLILLSLNTRFSLDHSSCIKLGRHILNDGRLSIIAGKKATISIGDGTYFNEGCMISSKSSVTIGEGCQFGPHVMIFDNNHCYTFEDGVLSSHTTSPISIGEHCWIGSNVVILKGSHIGKNCVIGAGCVISENVPNGTLVTQNRNLKFRSIEEKL